MKLRLLAIFLIFALVVPFAPAYGETAEYSMPYYITVDIVNQIVTVYSTEDDSIVRQMICSTGEKPGDTPMGVFYMPEQQKNYERGVWYYFPSFQLYGQYATRIIDGILFHSYPFEIPDEDTVVTETVEQLGTATSHGCIRLYPEDSKWIALNCLAGTRVHIFDTAQPDETLWDLVRYVTFVKDEGLTYEEFLNIANAKGTLFAYGDENDSVKELQQTLRDLGYYTGPVSGIYNAATYLCVRSLQIQAGLTPTGIANQPLLTLLNNGKIPAGMNTTLADGSTGEAVRMLQQNLTAMKLYSGEADGIYGPELQEAVNVLRGIMLMKPDGPCTPRLQQLAADTAALLAETFSGDFSIQIKKEPFEAGIISGSNGGRTYEYIGYYQRLPERTPLGAPVIVKGEPFPADLYEGRENITYAQSADGLYYFPSFAVLSYEYVANTVIYTDIANTGMIALGQHIEDYLTYRYEQYPEGEIPTLPTATVNTGDSSVFLNLRTQPDAEADVVAYAENGEHVVLVSVGEEWSKIYYNTATCYALTCYLNTGEQ